MTSRRAALPDGKPSGLTSDPAAVLGDPRTVVCYLEGGRAEPEAPTSGEYVANAESMPPTVVRKGAGLGLGLRSLRERVTAEGGEFTAGEEDGSWLTSVSVPRGKPAP